jgi:peptidyl-prolyl cis-trans isomerase A (cyclophilin A)
MVLSDIQKALRKRNIDGWLLCDFRSRDVLAMRAGVRSVALILTLVLTLGAHTGAQNQPGALPIVVVETELGNITLEIDTVRAPVTSANFLRYVREGFYDGGEFHRAVRPDNEPRKEAPIQVVQARINQERATNEYPPIPIERTTTTGLSHRNATVSMARDVTPTSPGPDTATSGFFITIGDLPVLDFAGGRSPDGQGFAAFGRVLDGMDVVKRIQLSKTPPDTPATPRSGPGQTLVPVIKIRRAYVR